MSFQINKQQFGEFQCVHLELTNVCRASILDIGCTLNRFTWLSKNIELINGYPNSEVLNNEISQNFKGVILAPFANRVNEAKYHFNQYYALDKVWPQSSFAIHGYMYNKIFEVASSVITDSTASQTFVCHYNGSDKGYPFQFKLEVTYTLHLNGKLTCSTIITNLYSSKIPFILGWHPLFFNVPSINKLKLNFNSAYVIELDDISIPIGSKPFNQYQTPKYITENIDHCFKLTQNVVTIIDDENSFKLNIIMDEGIQNFEYIQIYTPPQRQSIAIEPMSSWPDAFNNKNSLLQIEPNQNVSLSYSIQYQAI
jgi:aldose 1-epimerase